MNGSIDHSSRHTDFTFYGKQVNFSENDRQYSETFILCLFLFWTKTAAESFTGDYGSKDFLLLANNGISKQS